MAVEVLKLTYLWQDNDAKQLLILLFYTILFIFCFAHARVQYFFCFSHLSVILFISLTFFFCCLFLPFHFCGVVRLVSGVYVLSNWNVTFAHIFPLVCLSLKCNRVTTVMKTCNVKYQYLLAIAVAILRPFYSSICHIFTVVDFCFKRTER